MNLCLVTVQYQLQPHINQSHCFPNQLYWTVLSTIDTSDLWLLDLNNSWSLPSDQFKSNNHRILRVYLVHKDTNTGNDSAQRPCAFVADVVTGLFELFLNFWSHDLGWSMLWTSFRFIAVGIMFSLNNRIPSFFFSGDEVDVVYYGTDSILLAASHGSDFSGFRCDLQ